MSTSCLTPSKLRTIDSNYFMYVLCKKATEPTFVEWWLEWFDLKHSELSLIFISPQFLSLHACLYPCEADNFTGQCVELCDDCPFLQVRGLTKSCVNSIKVYGDGAYVPLQIRDRWCLVYFNMCWMFSFDVLHCWTSVNLKIYVILFTFVKELVQPNVFFKILFILFGKLTFIDRGL